MLVLFVALCGGFFAEPLCAQDRRDAREELIRRLEEEERRAVIDADTGTLERLWSPGMIVNNPQSTITPDRGAILNLVRSGTIRYARFERAIEAIRFADDLAIVMGAEVVEPAGNHPKAGRKLKRRFTNIWRETDGRWQVIARHANVVPE
ncbi:MAG TPA: nuclear transport factor 2 family protein [Opitutaceae bacterium]|nr:nuclear transport factor 2 family protein [Opitutaceae bacterium]